MSIQQMAFTPVGGLRDPTYSPTNPANEASIRDEMQGIPDQLRDYINNTLIPALRAVNIPVDTISGVTAEDVQAALTWLQSNKPDTTTVYLKTDIDNMVSTLNAAIALKANSSDMTSALALKADSASVYTKTEMDNTVSTLNSSIGTKANSSDVSNSLALKADSSSVYSKNDADNLLGAKANVTDVNSALALKADKSAVVTSISGTGGAQVINNGNGSYTVNVAGSGGDMLQSNYANGSGASNANKVDHAIYADSIPVASASAAGSVKQGTGVSIASDGTLSRDSTGPTTLPNSLPAFQTGTPAITLNQSLANGDGHNGTTGWTTYQSTVSAASGVFSDTGDGTGTPMGAIVNTRITCAAGKKIYVVGMVCVTNANCDSINLNARDPHNNRIPSPILIKSSPANGTWYPISLVIPVPSNFSGEFFIQLMHGYADATTANGKVMQFKNIMAFDMGVDASSLVYNFTAAQMFNLIGGGSTYFEGIQSFPASTSINYRDGSVVEGTLQGLTVNQVITGGNFATASSFVASHCAYTVSGNIATITGDGTSNVFGINQNFNIPGANHRYFVFTYLITTASNAQYISSGLYNGVNTLLNKIASPIANTWYPVYGIQSTGGNPGSIGNFGIQTGFADAATASGQVVKAQRFMSIDMGADASNPLYNLSAAEMFARISGGATYMEGQTTVKNPAIISTGKNLCNPVAGSLSLNGLNIMIDPDGTITLDGTATSNTFFFVSPVLQAGGNPTYSKNIFSFVPGKSYTISRTNVSGSATGNVTFTANSNSGESTTNIFGDLLISNTSKTAIPSYTGVSRFSVYITTGTVCSQYKIRFQLEQSTTATAWEQAKQSSLSIPTDLATGDTLTLRDGTAYKNGFPVSSTGALKAYTNGQTSISSDSRVLPLAAEWTYTNRMIQTQIKSGGGGSLPSYIGGAL